MMKYITLLLFLQNECEKGTETNYLGRRCNMSYTIRNEQDVDLNPNSTNNLSPRNILTLIFD